MMSMEQNNSDWKEIRARIDSTANAVFLIAGGALSISIGVLLREESTLAKAAELKNLVSWAWWLLLYPIVSFIALKTTLIVQSYHLLERPGTHDFFRKVTTWICWFLAVTGLLAFITGIALLIHVAGRSLLLQ